MAGSSSARGTRATAALLLPLALSSCLFVYRTPQELVAIDPAAPPPVLEDPVRAHLRDGSVVLFRNGLHAMGDTLVGAGERYGLGLEPLGRPGRLALDSVAALVSFTGRRVDGGRSLRRSLGWSLVVVVPVALLTALAVSGMMDCCGGLPGGVH